MAEANRYDFTPDEPRTVHPLAHGSLRRLLGVRDLYAIGYGDVGSSIFYALGITAAFALGATPLAIAVAGVFFVFTVLTYAELSAALPEAGGSQIFARRAFNDLASFTAGWALLLDYVLTAAISAYAIAPYLAQFWAPLGAPAGKLLLTTGVIGFLTYLNIVGIRESTTLSLVLAVAAGVTKALIIAIGLVSIVGGLGHFLSFGDAVGRVRGAAAPTPASFLYGISVAMVAYTGIEAVSQLSGEARDPGRTVPRAMLLTLATVLCLYVGISVVAVAAVDPKALGTIYQENPLVPIARAMPWGIGRWLEKWIGALAAVILLIATNAGVIGASRLAFSMAGHFQLPGPFHALHRRLKTPYVSLLVFSAAALAIIALSQVAAAAAKGEKTALAVLADLYNFGAMLAFSMAHLSLIGLRVKEPDLARPFKIAWNLRIRGAEIPVTAILGLLATGTTWVIVVVEHPYGRALGIVWMVVGFALYVNYRRRARIPVTRRVEIEPVSIPGYAELKFSKILVPTRGGTETETVQMAARIAKESGADLVAVYVMEVPQALPMESFLPAEHAEGTQALERAEAVARERGLPIEKRLLQSRSAAATIVELAGEAACDLIVMGAPPRRTPGTSVFGRTVDQVLRNAPCRVWVLTPGPKTDRRPAE